MRCNFSNKTSERQRFLRKHDGHQVRRVFLRTLITLKTLKDFIITNLIKSNNAYDILR